MLIRLRVHLCVQAVVIKQMDKHGFQGNIEFLTEVSKLSKLHQENLIDIIGYCADGDQRLLVYEHVDGGTLEDHLFGTFRFFIPRAIDRTINNRSPLSELEC